MSAFAPINEESATRHGSKRVPKNYPNVLSSSTMYQTRYNPSAIFPKFNNKQTNKKKKLLHPFLSYIVFETVSTTLSSTTSQSSLLFLFVPPIVNSPFRVKLLLRSHARSKVQIYIYTHSLYIYIYMYTYTVCVCMFTVKSVSFIRNVTLALVYNYADNHNVPEGNWCAWRDLITYAILCTRIKQKGGGRMEFPRGCCCCCTVGLVFGMFITNQIYIQECSEILKRILYYSLEMYDALFMHLCPFEFLTF